MKPWLTSFFSQWEPGLNLNATYKGEIKTEQISVHLQIREFNTDGGRNSGNNMEEGTRKTKKEITSTGAQLNCQRTMTQCIDR